LEGLNDAVVVVIDAILSSSSHSGEQKEKRKKKKLAADLPTAESKLYTTVTTLKSIVLDLFFYLKWHRASLLCFWIEC